jgi:hypothetical protein
MAAPNSVLSTTLQILRDKLVDNSYLAHPLFRALEQAGNIKKVSGGARIDQPVIFGDHSSLTDLTNGFEPVSLAVTDPFRQAQFEWSNFTQPVILSDVERLANKGDLAVVNILESKMKNVMLSLKKSVSRKVLVGDSGPTALQTLNGTGTSAVAADTTGWFQTAAFGSQATNTVGGLSKSTFAAQNWQNQVYDSSGTFALSHLDQLMINAQLYNPAGIMPSIILMSPSCYGAFMALQQSYVQYVDQAGRDSLDKDMVGMWRGAKIYVDPNLGFTNAAADKVSAYVLSPDTFELYVDTDGDFNVSDLIPVPGTATLMSRVLVRTQLVTGHLASHGILINAEA